MTSAPGLERPSGRPGGCRSGPHECSDSPAGSCTPRRLPEALAPCPPPLGGSWPRPIGRSAARGTAGGRPGAARGSTGPVARPGRPEPSELSLGRRSLTHPLGSGPGRLASPAGAGEEAARARRAQAGDGAPSGSGSGSARPGSARLPRPGAALKRPRRPPPRPGPGPGPPRPRAAEPQRLFADPGLSSLRARAPSEPEPFRDPFPRGPHTLSPLLLEHPNSCCCGRRGEARDPHTPRSRKFHRLKCAIPWF